jgi:ABC-type sulfate transport system permease component
MERFWIYSLAVSSTYLAVFTVPTLATQRLAFTPQLLGPLITTAFYSSLATAIVIPLSLLTSLGSLRSEGRIITALTTFPTAIPHTAIGVLLAPIFFRTGLHDTGLAVLTGMLVVCLPIGFGVFRSYLASLAETGYLEFLASLRVGGHRLILLILRSSKAALISAALLCWFRAFSELGVFFIIAQRPLTVGIYIYETFMRAGFEEVAGAALILLLVALLVSIALTLGEKGARD